MLKRNDMTISKGFCVVLKDLCRSLGSSEKIIIILTMLICVILYWSDPFCLKSNKTDFLNMFLDVIPTILGFTIASLALIYSFPEKVSGRLSKVPCNQKRSPFDELVAIMSVLAIIAVAAILFNLFAGFFDFLFYIAFSLSLCSLFLCLHIIFHLFTIRTFINPFK